MPLDGNVINFGADNTGVADSGPAFDDLFNNSDEAPYVPTGLYKIETPSEITRPMIVDSGLGSIASGYINHLGVSSAIRPAEQVRYVIPDNITPFVIKHDQVEWTGGCFDFMSVTGHTGFAFDIQANMVGELQPTRNLGWGVSIKGITVLGNMLELRDSTEAVSGTHAGTGGVRLNFNTDPDIQGFLYWIELDMKVFGCEKGLYAEPEFHVNQDCAQHYINIRANDTRSPLYSENMRASNFDISHFAGPVFPSQALADTTPAIYSRHSAQGTGRNLFLSDPFENFDAGQLDSHFHNSKTYNTDDLTQYLYPSKDSIEKSIRFGGGVSNWEYNSRKFEVGGAMVKRTATTAQFLDRTSVINNFGKARFVDAKNTTTGKVLDANGSGDTDVWLDHLGATEHTPS